MAEIAGLALGVLGIAGLFTACVENFDIVVQAKEFSEEFELLCTHLALQQIRLVIWGETLGLVPSPDGRRAQYKSALARPDIKPTIESSLNQLRSLLVKADIVTGRYALREEGEECDWQELRPVFHSKGMAIFEDSFSRFKSRIRQNQKQKSVWQVTRWSIHDYERFEKLVDQISKLLDALESITSALGVLERQHSLLVEEIVSLSDAESLSLLQQIGSSKDAPAALREVSDTASVCLTIVTSSSRSYYTAKSELSQSLRQNHLKTMLLKAKAAGTLQSSEAAHYQKQELPAAQMPSTLGSPATGEGLIHDIPQHQRWMAALVKQQSPRPPSSSSFSDKDLQYGHALCDTKSQDDESCRASSALLASKAHNGVPLARRVFLELRNIRRAAVPFISAAPIGGALDKILASIEGPPGTPYEGGIFWITVKISDFKPPLLRFHTRIYHPNIDPSGKLCADFASWWRDARDINQPGGSAHQRALPWFSDHITNHYSLGALLVALCGLLASPNVDDPLVPEIAEKYCTDYDGYCEAAKLYTRKYAHAKRPDECDLTFLEESVNSNTPYSAPEYQPKNQSASMVAEQLSSDAPIVWERISAYNLERFVLYELLRNWFPAAPFDEREIVRTTAPPTYVAPIPKALTEDQIRQINRARTAPSDDKFDPDSSHSDLESDSDSDSDSVCPPESKKSSTAPSDDKDLDKSFLGSRRLGRSKLIRLAWLESDKLAILK